ncbi:hypothetical protein [Marinobacter sp. ATCH36]|uniref:hypothetical protein n=1 Tax=Marinobacter sp. ATCH36 TaxID=2945106 RepID=UPI0020208160|nr:hypothetical protein [Marinobacter sp. ATCH36]MCL7945989.1 hypothetical protein [Marinobacter sp. ATCH36]
MANHRFSAATAMANARRLRFLVAICILFVLWWFLLGVLERQTERAENQSVNMVLSQLRSALVIKGAEVMLDRHASLEDEEGINPFELIEHQWGSYAGECEGSVPDPGFWCFRGQTQKETANLGEGWLIYNPRQPITINGRQASAEEPLAWRVEAEFADRNRNGIREQTERLTGLKLQSVPLDREAAP